MKKTASVLLLLLAVCGFQQMKYVKTKVNPSITIMLPNGFHLMETTELYRKFVAAKPPLAAYTDNATATIDIGVNVAHSQWNADDLDIMKSFYKSTLMGLYDEVQFITEGIEEIDGKNFAVFEFISVVKDDEKTYDNPAATSKYTRIHYGIINHKTLLLNFTCPANQRNHWAPVARHVLESAKISKTL